MGIRLNMDLSLFKRDLRLLAVRTGGDRLPFVNARFWPLGGPPKHSHPKLFYIQEKSRVPDLQGFSPPRDPQQPGRRRDTGVGNCGAKTARFGYRDSRCVSM